MIDTLLMFSGGLDSTGAFYQLIKNEKQLHVHHMHLKNKEKRCKAETVAVANMCKYMRNFGEFNYSESTHEYQSYNGNFIMDGDLASFMAGSICEYYQNIKYVAFGRTAEEFDENTSVRIEKASKIFTAFRHQATKIYPVGCLTKHQIFNILPEDLRELTWSCRTPTYKEGYAQQCGKCKTCLQIEEIKIKEIEFPMI